MKSQTVLANIDHSNSLPSNIQNLKDEQLSGNGFIVFEDFSKP